MATDVCPKCRKPRLRNEPSCSNCGFVWPTPQPTIPSAPPIVAPQQYAVAPSARRNDSLPIVLAVCAIATIGVLAVRGTVQESTDRREAADRRQESTPQSDPTPPVRSSETPLTQLTQEEVATTPDELAKFFDDNVVKATDWAAGKRIAVTGALSYVSDNKLGGKNVAVVFRTTLRRYSSPTVDFWFDQSFRSQVGGLREGQTITCVGTFDKTSWSGDIRLDGVQIRTGNQ